MAARRMMMSDARIDLAKARLWMALPLTRLGHSSRPASLVFPHQARRESMTGIQQRIVIVVALVTGLLATQALESAEPATALDMCTPGPCVAERG